MKTNVVNIKKITSVIIAFLMMILSVSYSGSKSEAANSARKYCIFNAKTGAKIGNDYILNMRESSNNSRAVIGEDERIIDWTKSGVVKLISYNDGYYTMGSGFVVSDHVIATAAHCIYDSSAKKGVSISEVLLFDNSGNVTMHATPVESHIPRDYITNNSASYIGEYDYALITVKEDLSEYACFDLGVPLDSFMESNSVVTVTGFPGAWGKPGEQIGVNTNDKHTMYSGSGKMHGGTDSIISYEADTTPGNSGSPVYITESAYGNTYYTVVGIYISEPYVDNPEYNNGTRITTDLINFYSNNNNNIKWE